VPLALREPLGFLAERPVEGPTIHIGRPSKLAGKQMLFAMLGLALSAAAASPAS